MKFVFQHYNNYIRPVCYCSLTTIDQKIYINNNNNNFDQFNF